ncbi:MAG: hypothetical protein ACXW3Z_02040 [Limisphaerales bacterium]
MKRRFFPLFVAGFILLVGSAKGAVVYDNVTTDEGFFNDSKLETGDEITLAGPERLLTDFYFYYYGDFDATGDERARLMFYDMDGPPDNSGLKTPGTLLYESPIINLQPGTKNVQIGDLALFVPDTFMWAVEFTGLLAGENIGLLFYDPPAIGSSDSYFWQEENGEWIAVAVNETGNNFAAQVVAVLALQITNVRSVESGAAITLSNTTPGKTYTLEYKSSVTQSGWTRGPSTVATGNSVVLIDTTANSATFRLYRVEEI